MAEFNVDTSFMNVKPQGSSLADMINIANQTQAYQQAQQVNPLKLRQEQLATQKAEEITPEEISQAKEVTKRSKFKTQEDYLNKLNEIRGALLNSESLKNNDVKGFTKQAIELREDAKKFGIPEEITEPEFAKLISTAHDPQKGLTFIQEKLGNVVRTGIGSQGQANQAFVPAGQQQQVQGTDIYGNPTITKRDQYGNIIGQAPLPVANDGTNASNMRYAPGETPETLKLMQEERTVAKNQAKVATSALANIQAVRKYLPLAQTGKGSEAIKGLQSVFGNLAGSTPEEKAASARDIVEKSIEDLATQKNMALGGKFQADLQAAQKSIASAEKNPTAILKSMQMLEPLIQHSVNYNQGLQAAIDKNNGNVQVKRKFDNEMIDAFDPQALNIYNAYKNKDTKEFDELTKGLSDTKKREIFNKMQKYNSLIQGNL